MKVNKLGVRSLELGVRSWELGVIILAFALSGCVVRTYKLTKDRVDQDLSAGNKGYLKGSGPAGEAKERPTTRTTQVVEVEMYPPIRFDRKTKVPERETMQPAVNEGMPLEGNKGYLMQSATPEAVENAAYEKYTVQKGDTLQKISQKFYGTTKKWMKIYDANKDVLKGPNKVYPGQSLNIPSGTKVNLQEPKENLK